MPRRNRNPRPRWPECRPNAEPEPRPLTTEEMARELVKRGLASQLILDGYRPRPRASHERDDR